MDGFHGIPQGGGPGGAAWLEFRLMADPLKEGLHTAGSPATSPLLSYDIVSANDSPERDPRDWVVEGLSLQDELAGRAWEFFCVCV